jgi:hypothetical protein
MTIIRSSRLLILNDKMTLYKIRYRSKFTILHSTFFWLWDIIYRREKPKKTISLTAWTIPEWTLKQGGIGVYNTCLWSKKGGMNTRKVRITIEEI